MAASVIRKVLRIYQLSLVCFSLKIVEAVSLRCSVKKRFLDRCFLMNLAKFNNRVLYGAPLMAACETVIKIFEDLLII